MKYGSIYSKDNIENKYNYSSTGGRRSSQNNFKTSHDHHTHSTLNTDGLLRSSSGTGYHSSGSSNCSGNYMFCCALVSGYCMTSYGVPCAAAMVLCVLIGLAFGIFNGWLVSYMSVPPFIVSMASMNIAKKLPFAVLYSPQLIFMLGLLDRL